MSNYINGVLTVGLMSALVWGVAAQAPRLPSELDHRLRVLRVSAERVCRSSDDKTGNYIPLPGELEWIVSRKNALLELHGYDSKCVQWYCAGGTIGVEKGISEQFGECISKERTLMSNDLDQLAQEITQGTGEYNYQNWKKGICLTSSGRNPLNYTVESDRVMAVADKQLTSEQSETTRLTEMSLLQCLH
jgi:hypothetical protein